MASRVEHFARELAAAKGRGTLKALRRLRTAVADANEHAGLNAKYRGAAQAIQRDGELEIDDDAIVSISDGGGAYVAAWVWIDDAAAGITDADTESAG